MLHIYTDPKYYPKDMKFIKDVEAFSVDLQLPPDNMTTRILKEIEGGTRQDSETFLDRYGRPLFNACLSTTSKILLLTLEGKYIINGAELGGNAIDLLMALPEGYISLVDSEYQLDEYFTSPVVVNNEVCSSGDAVFFALGGANE